MAVVSLLLGGCGFITYQEASLFRQAMVSEGNAERVDVNRSVRDIAATFRERASACLQTVTRTWSAHHAPLGTVTEFTYTPTIVEADGRVELHLQAKQTFTFEIGSGNPRGHYVLVVQVTPVDARRSRLEIWNTHSIKALPTAVKGWANGSFSGCPDLS